MDKKVFTMALMTILSAFILVVVIIYATNADKINKMLGRKDNSASVEVSTEELSVPQEVYGQQIGDDLKSFLYDEDFFDEAEKVPAVVVIQQNTKTVNSSSDSSSAEEGQTGGSGMAVVGQLDNPGAAASFGSSMGPGTEIPQGPIPGSETIGGTPVGNP
ncbi:MAG: hypothetical protein IJI01_08660 [Butyrivibrio sp.]|uniref:hypothetical protein n=1 Tax=Butyrivibrio sp. TaxID=28121 RepID=UPI0025B96257|nr:hypothetical protein [Butyrivibrio sp.]MBQ6588736.1 hypothetical protein [Butyrivibrio sp.]